MAEQLKHPRFRRWAWLRWVFPIETLFLTWCLFHEPLDGWLWVNWATLVWIVLVLWKPELLPKGKGKNVVLEAEVLRLPNLMGDGEQLIPRAQVEEISPSSLGVIIAWKKNGVPWYSELMEWWFAPSEWAQLRAALQAWVNSANPDQAGRSDGPDEGA